MTAQNEDNFRHAFEKFGRAMSWNMNRRDMKGADGSYCMQAIEFAWQGYQAAIVDSQSAIAQKREAELQERISKLEAVMKIILKDVGENYTEHEGDSGNAISEHARLKSERDCLQNENEALKRERAMLIDAINCVMMHKYILLPIAEKLCSDALSTTEPQAAQWLADKLAAAKQSGYVQAEQKYLAQHHAAFMTGKQTGRDEVLRELSEQPAYSRSNFGDYLIIRPSAPEKGNT